MTEPLLFNNEADDVRERLISIDEFDEAPTIEMERETLAQEAARWEAEAPAREAARARLLSTERPTRNIRPPVKP